VRWIAAIILLMISTLPGAAQAPGDEDQRLVCPVISAELASSIAAHIKGGGRCMAPCRGCGCKGGPGYRAPDGRCPGYAQLIQTCGPPPHAKCKRECTPIVAGCLGRAAGRAWLRTFAAGLGLKVTFAPAEAGADGAPAQGGGERKP
jgi:hypothetical protein